MSDGRPDKLTLAVDFDGVIHSYTSGWTGVLDINDPPVDGAIEWLTAMVAEPDVEIIIHSCRFAMEPETAWYWEDVSVSERRAAMSNWLERHGMDSYAISLLNVWFYKGKPHAAVYIDDRGFRFVGDFPSLAILRALKPWNRP